MLDFFHQQTHGGYEEILVYYSGASALDPPRPLLLGARVFKRTEESELNL